jgi:hypothetical protein
MCKFKTMFCAIFMIFCSYYQLVNLSLTISCEHCIMKIAYLCIQLDLDLILVFHLLVDEYQTLKKQNMTILAYSD